MTPVVELSDQRLADLSASLWIKLTERNKRFLGRLDTHKRTIIDIEASPTLPYHQIWDEPAIDSETGVPAPGSVLCHVDDIPMESYLTFRYPGKSPFSSIILRGFGGSDVIAWQNWCPHRGHVLDSTEDDVIDESKELLVCASHSAMFLIDNGKCISGPCEGLSLRPVPVSINSSGHVIIGQFTRGNEDFSAKK